MESALRELNKIQFCDENLHEIKNETLRDYVGEFEMVGNLKVADQSRQTHSRFRNVGDYEPYINSIDQDYDSEDTFFKGYFSKISTPQFKKVNRYQ